MTTEQQDRGTSAPGAITITLAVPRPLVSPIEFRLRKHADYQRAYKASRKQFSPSMTYFVAARPEASAFEVPCVGPRVGITAGRVLGNAVERNRIKRRLREAIRCNLQLLPAGVDVILHPRKSLLTIAYADLRLEVERIFKKVSGGALPNAGNTLPARPSTTSGRR